MADEGCSFPSKHARSPSCTGTWTLPHLIQLQHEYKKLEEDFNCDIQEFITVQDPPAPLSNILHLPPLTCLREGRSRITGSDDPTGLESTGSDAPADPSSQLIGYASSVVCNLRSGGSDDDS